MNKETIDINEPYEDMYVAFIDILGFSQLVLKPTPEQPKPIIIKIILTDIYKKSSLIYHCHWAYP